MSYPFSLYLDLVYEEATIYNELRPLLSHLHPGWLLLFLVQFSQDDPQKSYFLKTVSTTLNKVVTARYNFDIEIEEMIIRGEPGADESLSL